MARPNRYKKLVEPYLSQVSEMSLTMTEEQIAHTLGVSLSTWKRYKKQYEPLRTAIKKGRKDLVKDLKSTLIRKARGFTYEEKKTIKVITDEGVLVPVKEEIYTKYATPDVAALNLLLKNYDKENWANDPQALALKERELDIKEKKIESEDW